MHVIPFILAAGLAVVLYLIVYQAERWRENAIRSLAARAGFHYLGDGLPRSLPLQGDPLGGVTRVWNVVDGEPQGIRVIAFDCRIGRGKGSWRRTVIAVEKSENLRESLAFNFDVTTDSLGSWCVFYRPRGLVGNTGLMPVDEVEAYLKSLASNTAQKAV